MIVLLDTSQPLAECSAELGTVVKQLFTPLTNFNPQQPEDSFAIDNGAFSRFDPNAFRRLLEKHRDRKSKCIFVAMPDVVGSAIRTLECYSHWSLLCPGWKRALVVQDGQESLPIPWRSLDAVFIGGTTEWKMSAHAARIIKAAKAFEKWVHVGRVNTPGRFEHFAELDADSIDGTGLSRYSHMRRAISDAREAPRLF